ncbi:MAG: murein transglycosylase A [Leptolyngbya sp. SIO4C1]|nr:murein transglycosylase A [Leptolyngbya sp. SIO4C1]
MNRQLSSAGLAFLSGLAIAIAPVAAAPSLPEEAILAPVDCPLVSSGSQRLAYDELLLSDRQALLQAVDYSLAYLDTPAALAAYRDYPVPGITRDRVRQSLVRFRQLVATSPTAEALQQAVLQDFEFYRSVGQDGEGSVAFTGYFEPTYGASRVPTAEYRYPLYRRPADLDSWSTPHPTRLALEGADGLQSSRGALQGLELVWLKDRLEAFLVQVQGSARLQLTDGTLLTVGYAGRTDYPYTSIGRALIDDGIIAEEDLSLPVLIDYFRQQPEQLTVYLPRNNRFVFFKETDGAPATGSLSLPVTAGRSIATDKSLMPPGALALISLPLPQLTATGNWTPTPTSRFVLDQDTGGAIRGPGRVDLFVGTGTEAGAQAGLINHTGQLYYLLLKDEPE